MRDQTGARGPDFLVIGAPRCGTSWLYVALRDHPALWLAPVKELHYFDKPMRTRTALDAYEWRRVRPLRPTPWHFRFLFGKRNDAWYASLFVAAQRKGLIAGEATPDYCALRERAFARIYGMNPGMKLVLVMRDPVERSWSAVNNAARKGRIGTPLDSARAVAWASRQSPLSRSLYIETIKRLEAVFPASQLHYCFFDDLVQRPGQLLAGVLDFLGVPSNEMPPLPAAAVNAVVQGKAVPTEFARSMAKLFLPSVEALCSRFDGPPQIWRERYEVLLGDRRRIAAKEPVQTSQAGD